MRKFLSLSVSILESLSRRKLPNFPANNRVLRSYLTFKTMGSVICKNSPPAKETAHKGEGDMDDIDEYVEGVVCQDSDIKENEMKVVDLEDFGKVLLVRQKGKLSALGHKCTHYGAPLVNGALSDGRIRCQWHGACFNILTGDIEDFPGLDSLPCYQVTVEDNNVKVRGRRSHFTGNKRMKPMSKRDVNNDTCMIVIGGGPSGECAVETLRQEGFTGRIVLFNKEDRLPYDRVKVSKALDFQMKSAQFRKQNFYDEFNIEMFINTEVTKVDVENKTVELQNKETFKYDCLYIATGSKARKLPIEGADLPQVHVLREHQDAINVQFQLTLNTDLVILGISFIGMEAAAYCVSKVKSVTVVGRDNVPFKQLFGEDIGRAVMKLFEEKGVKFCLENGIKKINGEANKLKSVELNDGTVLPATLCIMGIGSTFYTDFLKDSGININSDGSISVNEFLETNIKGVFAGGDIAKAPVFVNNNEPSAIGHYPLAHYHGKIAALNMLGKSTPLKSVPFFWTQLFGKSIRYAGHGKYDDLKIYGDLEQLKFIAYYFRDDKVVAMASCQRDPLVAKFAELLAEGKRLTTSDVADERLDWAN